MKTNHYCLLCDSKALNSCFAKRGNNPRFQKIRMLDQYFQYWLWTREVGIFGLSRFQSNFIRELLI